MKRSIARAWAKELESGEYKQGKYRLRNKKGGWCCLGLLCNLHAQAHPEIAAMQKLKTEYMGSSEVLPIEVMQWAGMGDEHGLLPENIVIDGLVYSELTGLNDRSGLTFPEIAKVIRKHWKDL